MKLFISKIEKIFDYYRKNIFFFGIIEKVVRKKHFKFHYFVY